MPSGTADALGVGNVGRRDWTKVQGRANAALLLLARDMCADFVEPRDTRAFAAVRGRTNGCTFELQIGAAAKRRDPGIVLTVRHFTHQATATLGGPGLDVPELDPHAMRTAIEQACYSFATNR